MQKLTPEKKVWVKILLGLFSFLWFAKPKNVLNITCGLAYGKTVLKLIKKMETGRNATIQTGLADNIYYS